MKLQKELLDKAADKDRLAIRDLVNRFFTIRYVYNGKINFENGANGFREGSEISNG